MKQQVHTIIELNEIIEQISTKDELEELKSYIEDYKKECDDPKELNLLQLIVLKIAKKERELK